MSAENQDTKFEFSLAKYLGKPVTVEVDGAQLRFDSTAEHKRWQKLQLIERAAPTNQQG